MSGAPGRPSPGGVIAIDLGTRRTGFAVCDRERILAQPLEVVELGADADELLEHLAGLLDERDVATLVVGLPLVGEGRETERAAASRAFAERLAERFPELEVVLHDERLTTREAEDLLREAGHHGRARKARRDSWSAWVLLEDWLRS